MSSPERAALEHVDDSLRRGERDGALAALAWLGGHPLVDEDALRGPVRRALLLLAAGGDPRRELGLGDRAVTSLAAELRSVFLPDALRAALEELAEEAAGLPSASEALATLIADDDLAARAFACSLLAEQLGERPGE